MRNATTGSFFAAAFAGIRPLISVNVMLMTTIITAEAIGKDASVVRPGRVPSRALIPTDKR